MPSDIDSRPLSLFRKIISKAFLFFTIFLISFLVYTSQIFILYPAHGYVLSVDLLKHLIPFNILTGLLWWNFYKCATTDPGGVPKGWVPPRNEDVDETIAVEVKKLTGEPRKCRTCRQYKPPRAHHCRQCGRCILRMDHHCPWVSNCIGHRNYVYFLRFLFYVIVSCSFHLYLISHRTFGPLAFTGDPTTTEVILIILNYTFCVPVLLAVGVFAIYHAYAVWTNTTTIEAWEKDRVATLVRRGEIREVKFPFSLSSPYANAKAVFGDNPLLWCLPCGGGMKGDGLVWEIDGGDDPSVQYNWPPNAMPIHRNPKPSRYARPAFTYGTGLNPTLVPTSTRRRKVVGKDQISNLPPYHPNYRPPGQEAEEEWERSKEWEGSDGAGGEPEGMGFEDQDDDDDVPLGETLQRRRVLQPGQWEDQNEWDGEEEEEEEEEGNVRVREGSEGYEVRPKSSDWGLEEGVKRRLIADCRRGIVEQAPEAPYLLDGEEAEYDQFNEQSYESEGWEELEQMADGGAMVDEDKGEINTEELARWERYKRYVPEPDEDEESDFEEAGSEDEREG